MDQSPNLFSKKALICFQSTPHRLRVTIETARLYIHSYKDDDFENCVLLYGDEKITKFFDHGKPRSRREVESLIYERGYKYFVRGEPFGLFSIFDKKDMTFIGQMDLIPTDEPKIMEIGCILHRQHHNQGFAIEAMRALLLDYVQELNSRDFKCNRLPIQKIIATVHPKNHGSKRLIRMLGMAFEKYQERFGGSPRLWYSYIPAIINC